MTEPIQYKVVAIKVGRFLFRPPAARVSGIVEESPGNLEYEVALFREAARDEDVSNNEVPVDQAVAIGTKLQLRATINSQQSGKFLKIIL